jgi:hypothetical protein
LVFKRDCLIGFTIVVKVLEMRLGILFLRTCEMRRKEVFKVDMFSYQNTRSGLSSGVSSRG